MCAGRQGDDDDDDDDEEDDDDDDDDEEGDDDEEADETCRTKTVTPPLFFLFVWFWTRRASLRIQELRRAEGHSR